MLLLPQEINNAADIFLPLFKIMLVLIIAITTAGYSYEKLTAGPRLRRRVDNLRRQGRIVFWDDHRHTYCFYDAQGDVQIVE